jgi:hypothetical protein
VTAKAAVITGDLLKRKGADRSEVALSALSRSKKVGVRLDNDRYVRLKTFAAQHDMTGEEVLMAALDAYLNGAGQIR